MSVLYRKLLRDLLKMKGQSFAIGILIALAVGTFVGSASTHRSLVEAHDSYYSNYRFGHIFAEVARAPVLLENRIRNIEGVEEVNLRLAAHGLLNLDFFDEPISARIVALPEDKEPNLGRIHIRQGTMPRPGTNEAVVSEGFAKAHNLKPGDTMSILVNGRHENLVVCAVGISPEHIYEVKPGDLFPDDLRFGILWVRSSVLETALGMKNSFNELVLLMAKDAQEASTIAAVDELLKPYGGLGAYGRRQHVSARFISEELEQLEAMAFFVPAIFLGVAVFLLNIIVGRTISMQREQIATLKALGFSNFTIALHYLYLVSIVVFLGSMAGGAIGYLYGILMAGVYVDYYKFPNSDYSFSFFELSVGTKVAFLAAILGTLSAVKKAVKLQPAEAMKPAAPPVYKKMLLEKLGLFWMFSMPGRMVLRNISRRPLRSMASVIGISFSVALLVTGLFFGDAMSEIVDSQFRYSQRQDLTLTFSNPVSKGAIDELIRLPGVLYAEPKREVAAVLKKGHRTYKTVIVGVQKEAALFRILSESGEILEVPEHGLMISETLAHNIGASMGDSVEVELKEGRQKIINAQITAIANEPFGTTAYASIETARDFAGGNRDITSVLLKIDTNEQKQLYKTLSSIPAIASVTSRQDMLASFDAMTEEVLLFFAGILALFAGAMAMGVVYNAARISLSERQRELATMRVIGMTRAEISTVLLGELFVLVALALPTGCILGYGLSVLTAHGVATEMYRIPAIVLPRTYLFSMFVVVVSSLIVAFSVRKRLDKLDLISVLKTRE